MNKHKIREALGLATILLAWVLVVLGAIHMLYPYEPLVVNRVETVGTTFKSGGILIYEVDYCKNYNIPGTISKLFEDGIVYRLRDEESNVEVGCHNRTFIQIIPISLPAGKYKMCTIIQYDIEPFRHVIVKSHSNEFEVTNG